MENKCFLKAAELLNLVVWMSLLYHFVWNGTGGKEGGADLYWQAYLFLIAECKLRGSNMFRHKYLNMVLHIYKCLAVSSFKFITDNKMCIAFYKGAKGTPDSS